ncbi:MAG: hypothetical protein R2761_30005 [Acidimicrobiales bacterium]
MTAVHISPSPVVSPVGDVWVTPDAPPVDGTITVDQVVEGDLVFCARPGLLQDLCSRAGEPWRHVGLAVTDREGRLSISEVAGPRFGLRPLEAIVERYEAMAVGRVAPAHQLQATRAAQWTAMFVDRPQVYAWDDLILAGLVSVSRCYVLPTEEPVLERALRAATSALARVPHGPEDRNYTCSSFIAAALTEAELPLKVDLVGSRCGSQRPSLLDLARRRRRPLRAGAGSHITGDQLIGLTRAVALGVLAAGTGLTGATPIEHDALRWITPGDLWRSDLLAHRWFLPAG